MKCRESWGWILRVKMVLATALALSSGALLLRASDLVAHQWIVDGTPRQALIWAAKAKGQQPPPILFVFHGYGGGMEWAAEHYAFHLLWPEAMVVYAQGLPLTGRANNKAGWQMDLGQEGDRDLRFFDTLLSELGSDYPYDRNRVFVTGHSNGGVFTYLLWGVRAEKIAALAPTGAAMMWRGELQPKPAFLIDGKADPLVKPQWQKHTVERVFKANRLGASKLWRDECTLHSSSAKAPTVRMIHDKGHRLPDSAPGLIVRFFREVNAMVPNPT